MFLQHPSKKMQAVLVYVSIVIGSKAETNRAVIITMGDIIDGSDFWSAHVG